MSDTDWIWYGIESFFCFGVGWLLYDIFKPRPTAPLPDQIAQRSTGHVPDYHEQLIQQMRLVACATPVLFGSPTPTQCSFCGGHLSRDSSGRCVNCGAA